MGIRTPEEYKKSLRDGRVVYYRGEKVADVTSHPSLRVCVEQCAYDYIFAQDPRYRDLMVQPSDTGEPVSFVFMAPKSAEDLLRRREIIQTMARTLFGIPGGAKFTGIDGLNALAVVCRRMDRELGTDYTSRLEAHRKHLQKHDLAVALAMTDVKGDRSVRPSKQQPHRDYYLRIVDESSDGIVVRGAKAHISQSPGANELFVLPCRAMREDEKDYAVSFALPVNTKGLSLIVPTHEAPEEGNFFDYPASGSFFLADALVIFDEVFVPMERVFMKGEWKFSGDLAYMFGNFHRLSADSYKYAELELLAGAAALIAEYNGLERISHVQDKLSWLAMYAEGTEALGRAACQDCVVDRDSGLVYPNPMYSNVAKFFFADNFHQAMKHLQDIAGGIVATVPSAKDFLNPATRPVIEKYLGGKAGVPAEHRMRAIKLVKDLTSSYQAVTTLHAEGSLAAQRLSINVLADWERYKAAAKRAARIADGKQHPAFATLPALPT